MEEVTRAIIWEAPEHNYGEKSADWYWVLGIVATGAAIAAFLLGNFLFTILIIVGAFSMALISARKPQVIEYEVANRGIRIGDAMYNYSTLDSYCIDEESSETPTLLVKSKSMHLPLLSIPLPVDHVYAIEDFLLERLPEDDLEEPFGHKLLEFVGF